MHKLILSLSLLIAGHLCAQQYCYTTEMQNAWFSKHPELRAGFEKHKQEAAELDRENYRNGYASAHKSAAAAGNYTIPVVFHILHLGGGENISDAQVIDAVNILTRDFNCANADTSNVVVQFKHLIGNPAIDFQLATLDPDGNCTNGIIRHYDPNTNWSGNFSDYAYTWPPTSYLNIYVVRTLDGGAAGYTFLPNSGIPPEMDAIVILSGYVGSIGSGNPGTSRALTHEVGHWLDLDHVWGGTNQPGVSCGDDGVSDTPVSKGYSSCNLANAAICTPGVVENVQNYMEYAYCQRMFTIGQSVRMLNAINSPVAGRNNLSSPNNLANTGITSPGVNCVPGLDISASPSFSICQGKTLTLSTFTFNAAPTSFSWSADNGAAILNPTAATTSIQLNMTGVTHVTCVVANANGSDTKSIAIVATNGAAQIINSNTESFEASGITPPAFWKIINPSTPAQKWEVMTGIGTTGIRSMYIPGETMTPNSLEILESPVYDFKNNPGAQFSFKYAYAKYHAGNNDVFKVQASKNCGGTWTDVWVPSNSNLAQNSGGVSSDLFTPVDEQWKLKSITDQPQFFPFKSEESVLIRFYFMEDKDGMGFGNRFYLDEVHFGAPVGINELSRSIGLNIYPNPSGSVFNIAFNLSDASRIKYQVSSVAGAILIDQAERVFSEGQHEIRVNENTTLPAGIYFINVELNGTKLSRKIVVN